MERITVGVILARGGSKSIPLKNIRNFNGKPLMAWTILHALNSGLDRVFVSTDSLKIKEIAVKYGAEVPFLRDARLAQDNSSVEPAIRTVVDYLRTEEKQNISAVALLQPTTPFRKVSDIDEALQVFANSGASSVVSVTPAIANQNPHWMLKRTDEGRVKLFNGEELKRIKNRRQALPEVFIRNDFVYVLRPENLYEDPPTLYGETPELMVVDENRLDVDINNERDWAIAEIVHKIFLENQDEIEN